MLDRDPLCAFSAALEPLLGAGDATRFEAIWNSADLEQIGREALAHGSRAVLSAARDASVDRVIRANSPRRSAAPLSGTADSRIAVCARGSRGAAPVRSAARDRAYRPGPRPLRSHACIGRRPQAHGTR